MKTKYFNDAIIGNKNMVASYSKKGELLRIYYPQTDFKQFIDFMNIGMKINDSGMIYLHNDVNNTYKQYYIEDTNVLNTEITNSYFKIKVIQTDFISVKNDVLIKRYIFENQNDIDLNVNLLLHSKMLTNTNNSVSGMYKDECLTQYTHDYTFCIFSKEPALSYQINDTESNIQTGIIEGKDYVGMSDDSSVSYDIGVLNPGEKRIFDVFIYINDNKEKSVYENVESIKNLDVKSELDNTKKYWRKYLKNHDTLDIEEKNKYWSKISKIYKRTILLYPLLINQSTGGISAAIEVDEEKTKCGRYSYCWPRDAVFITKALDILKMEKETEKFYKSFCKNTQSKNGMWEQRFYTDGTLAPCWGYQIDETAAVIFGVYNHYEHTKDEKFLKDNLKMCEKAIVFLKKYVENIFENGNKIKPSYDLWEENEGIHTYSLACIFAAFESILKMYEVVKPLYVENRLKLEQIHKEELILEKYLLGIKEYIIKNLYDNDKKSFIRNKDGKMDISLLGLVYPFKLFGPKEKKIENTVERIHLTLRTYTGGYLRYEGDNYIGGNPWLISNLWLANYYLDLGERKKAKEYFDFVVKTSTELGFLGEQADNEKMKVAWVIGLGWSHAMFITTLQRLMSPMGQKEDVWQR